MRKNRCASGTRGRPPLPEYVLEDRKRRLAILRAEDKSLEEICTDLGLSKRSVEKMISNLIKEKMIAPRTRGRKGIPTEEREAREQRVVEMWAQDLTDQDMATTLRVSLSTIRKWISSLVAEGRIIQTDSQKRKSTCADLNSNRVQTIISMERKVATLQEMGKALGVTNLHGKELLEEGRILWRVRDVAKALNVSPALVSARCADGTIPSIQRGSHTGTNYLIATSELENLKIDPSKLSKKAK